MEKGQNRDPEELILFLTSKKGITLNKIIEKIGVKRTQMMSYRRSTKPGTKMKLYEDIEKAFPEYFGEQKEANENTVAVNKNYFELLQRTVERQQEEITWLRKMLEAGKK